MIAQPSQKVFIALAALCVVLGGLVFAFRRESAPALNAPQIEKKAQVLKDEPQKPVAPEDAKKPEDKMAEKPQDLPQKDEVKNTDVAGLPVPPTDAPELLNLKAETTLSISSEGNWDDSLKQFTAAFLKLEEVIASQRLEQAGPYFVVYSELNDLGFQFKASVPVKLKEGLSLPPGVMFDQSPEGKAVRLTHRGPFENIAETYDAVDEYSSKEGFTDENVFIEQYLTQLKGVDDEDLLINVYVKVK